MKICSPQLGVSKTSSLGGEIYDYETLKGFSKKGIEVYVYLPRGRSYDKKLKNFHVTYSFVKHVVPPLLYSFICLPYLFRTYNRERFDILRIHSPRFLGLAAIVFHFFHPKVPILASAVTPKESKMMFYIEKITYKISKKIIVQSNYMKNKLHSVFKIPRDKIAVTYGGSSTITQSSSRKPSKNYIGSSNKIILFMGIMTKRKNPVFLVDVIKKVSQTLPEAKIVFIGTGEQRDDVRKALEKNNLVNKAILIDSAYHDEKAFWLGRADIFTLPSLDEGFGLALIEAMSYGKPAVVSNIPPFMEIIENGHDGFTLPLDSNIWTNTIISLLTDEKLKLTIGKEAKKKAGLFAWDRMSDLNEQIVKGMTG